MPCWQLHSVAGIFYTCQISLVHFFQPLALCNIREVMKGHENVPKSSGSEEFRVSQMEEEFRWFVMDCWADKNVQEIRRGRSLNPLSAFWHQAYFKVDRWPLKSWVFVNSCHILHNLPTSPCLLCLGIGNNCCYGEVNVGVNHAEIIPQSNGILWFILTSQEFAPW